MDAIMLKKQGGGAKVAKGEFTPSAYQPSSITITHNLNSRKLIILCNAKNGQQVKNYRVTWLFTATFGDIFSGYEWINNGTPFTFDTSTTKSYEIAQTDNSVTTSAYSSAYSNCFVLTDNSVQFNFGGNWSDQITTYEFTIVALD